ncbi:MAG: hypothetical protein K2X99_13355, partial [Gemmatimonadaceae bacterium]|nr:hypothetical protein [Gemmatimonadaceae bacterium]
ALAFVASGTHITRFTGGTAHTVTFGGPGQSQFGAFENSGSGAVSFLTNATIAGGLTVAATGGAVTATGGGRTLTVGTGVTDIPGSGGSFTADTVVFATSGTVTIPPTLVANLRVSANVLLANNGYVNKSVRITSGSLDLNGKTFSVLDSLVVMGTGQLKSVTAASSASVDGDVRILSTTSGVGFMTAGQLTVGGHFSQGGHPQSFFASGSHLTMFNGPNPQTVTFASPDTGFNTSCITGSCFNNLTVSKGVGAGGVIFQSAAKARNDIQFLTADSIRALGQLVIAGNYFNASAPAIVRISRFAYGNPLPLRTAGLFAVDTMYAIGSAGIIALSENLPVRVIGDITMPARTYSSVTVDGAGAKLRVSGKDTIFTDLITKNGGVLITQNAADTLFVHGNATFSGGSTTGLLTAGGLTVLGNFTATTASAFDASGTHLTTLVSASARSLTMSNAGSGGFQNLRIDGASPRSLTSSATVAVKGQLVLRVGTGGLNGTGGAFLRLFGNVRDSAAVGLQVPLVGYVGTTTLNPRLHSGNVLVAGSLTLSDTLVANGQLQVDGASGVFTLNNTLARVNGFTTTNGGRLISTQSRDSLVTLSSATFSGGNSTLSAGYLMLPMSGTSLNQSTNALAFAATGTHETHFLASVGTQSATFANPGWTASKFGELYLGGVSFFTGSDLYAEEFESGVTATHGVGTLSTMKRIYFKGGDLRDMLFTNVGLQFEGGGALTDADSIVFTSMDATSEYVRVRRAGGSYNFSRWGFTTPQISGKYLVLVDTAPADLNPLTVTMTSGVTPAAHGGFVTLTGGAVLNNWPAVLTATWTGATSVDWNTASNWSTSAVPTLSVNVVVPSSPIGGRFPTLSSSGAAANFQIGPAASLNLNSNPLFIYGSFDSDTLPTISCGSSGGKMYLRGSGAAVRGKLCNVEVEGTYTASGVISVVGGFSQGNLRVGSVAGSLTFNGNAVRVSGNLETYGSGVFVQNNAADDVRVGLDAVFAGGTSTWSAGNLNVGKAFTVTSVTGFVATGAHRVQLDSSGHAITFSDTTSRFRRLEIRPVSRTITTAMIVTDSMILKGTNLYSIGANVRVGGPLLGNGASTFTVSKVELNGALSDTGTFNPDTVVFNHASPTLIPSSIGPNVPTWNHVVVTGKAIARSDTTMTFGRLTVRGSGELELQRQTNTTQLNITGDLNTAGTGTLKMTSDPNLKIEVNGNATFAGGSTTGKLTNGSMTFRGNLTQSGASSTNFVTSTTYLYFDGTMSTISLANPSGNPLSSLWVSAGKRIHLATDVSVLTSFGNDGLSADSALVTAATGAGNTRTLTVQGIADNGPPSPWRFSNVRVDLGGGIGSSTFNNVLWTDFPAGYTGVVFNVNRALAATFNYHSFNTISLGAGGYYLRNQGSNSVTMNYANPSSGTGVSLNTGSGSIAWP